MDNRGEATVSGVVGVIAATSDGFVTPRKTGARNGVMALLSTEDTD